jgi:hypothetical protein
VKSLAYPLFGALVLGVYYYTAVRGIDPFAVSTERHAATGPAGARGPGRPSGGFFYGGWGGGK